MHRRIVVFDGLDAAGRAGLWETNGTAAGTHEINGISDEFDGGLFHQVIPDFTLFNNDLLFGGSDAAGSVGLWVTNGTVSGTHELTGISGANAGGIFLGIEPQFVAFNSEVLFDGVDTSRQNGIWVTDGTAAGTHELTGISGANAGGIFAGTQPQFAAFNSEVLFNGVNARGQSGLWATDGTAAGTHELTGISGAFSSGLSPSHLTVFGGEVLFNGKDASGQRGLWVTDGTAAGTHELTGISGASSSGLAPFDFTVFNGEVLFDGQDASGQFGLWVTDGAAAGTHELTGISGANIIRPLAWVLEVSSCSTTKCCSAVLMRTRIPAFG